MTLGVMCAALVACGGGGKMYSESATAGCLMKAGFEPVVRKSDYIADDVGGWAVTVPQSRIPGRMEGLRVNLAFGRSTSDAKRIAQRMHLHDPPEGGDGRPDEPFNGVSSRNTHLVSRRGNVVIRWGEPTTEAEKQSVEKCLREAPR
jgi:hypothetical protein